MGGQLTIAAENSSLSDIISVIQRITGARLEGVRPDSERVFGQFGPGPPRDVLNALFTGSRYDFILVSDIDNPDRLQKIMLSPHGPAAGSSVAANQPASRPYSEDEEDSNEGVVPPQPVAEQPSLMPNQANVPSEQSQPPQPGQQQQQQVKTPEQLLQELQRLRQQQQQQQQPQTNPR